MVEGPAAELSALIRKRVAKERSRRWVSDEAEEEKRHLGGGGEAM